MPAFLEAYFWIMAIYLLVTVIGLLARAKKVAAANLSAAMWAEQVASYVFLVVGLLGVYGHVHATPFLVAWFWQVFLVVFVAFVALQHRMPKTKSLRESHGAKGVVIATVVGLVLLVPMFIAVGIYGFGSAALWA